MNKYESVVIIKPKLKEDDRNQTIEKFKNIMEGFSDKEVGIEEIGEKKLAYEIQKNKTGYYVLFNFYAKLENVQELERNYRIDDDIMKFIVVRQEEREFDESEEEEDL